MAKSEKITTSQPKDITQDWANLKDLILRLLPPIASLVAVSLAGVSLFQLLDKLSSNTTILDEILAVSALILLLCYPITIWAVHTRHMGRAFLLGRMTLTMFLSAVMLLVFVGCRVLLGLAT